MVRAPPHVLTGSLSPSGMLGGGVVRSRFSPTWLGVTGVAVGRPRGGCLLLLRGASGVRRSPSPDCPPTGRAVGVRDPRVVGAGVRVWGPFSVPSACTPCGGCAPRGGSVAFMCRGAGWGGVRRTPRLCGRGGACRAGGRSASFRPSAYPWAGNKAAVTGVVLSMEGVAPHTTPVRAHPPSLGVICAASWRVGAGSLVLRGPRGSRRLGRGGGPRSGSSVGWGGDHPPCVRGSGPGPPRLAGRWGGGGGGRAAASLLPFWVAACGTQSWPPSCRQRTPFGVRVRLGSQCRPGVGGVRGGPWTAPPGAPADLNPPSALPEWAVVTGGSCGARPLYCSVARVAPARWCGLAPRPRPPREQVQPHPPSAARGGGGREGSPPPWFKPPSSPGPASDKAALFAPSWASPVRCRPAAGRACRRLPRPWCPRTPGAAASSGGLWGRRFLSPPSAALGPEWEGGGGEWGGPSGPSATPPDGRGGGGMAVPAPGARHRLGGRTLPPPPST